MTEAAETLSPLKEQFKTASQKVAALKEGNLQDKLIATDEFKRALAQALATFVSLDGQEKKLSLSYEEKDFEVFPPFVQEFLTKHIEREGNLLVYININEGEVSFGLKDEAEKTNLAVTLFTQSAIYHPIGFWGSYPKVRSEWQWRNRPMLNQVSQAQELEFPQALSEEEASLMLSTARFIAEHLEKSSK